MGNNPFITIGIICRNEKEHIGNTIKHVLAQTYRNFELVIIDGNSTDGTRDAAKDVLSKSKIPHKVLNEKDFGFYGPCFARNLVIDNSSKDARYIAFIDADCVADRNWLRFLVEEIEKNKNNKEIAGAGGPRLIADTKDKKELAINAVLTSFIASGGNPAFSKRKIKFIDSVPNYNAIYKKEIISKFRYDDSLIVSDDNELNFRLRKAGYKFIYADRAKIYHHETNSIKIFARNMFSYGINITNTVRKHKSMVRITVPATVLFLFYLILLVPGYFLLKWIAFIPLVLYFLFVFAIFVEILSRTKTAYSLLAFILVPVQHIFYAFGIIYNFIFKKPLRKK
jgi:glycosyltransferase involved in cell wall biosynthesis